MLKINVKEGESIDRVLKKYKRKCEQTRLLKYFRTKQNYIKPSLKRRIKILKAKYKQSFLTEND